MQGKLSMNQTQNKQIWTNLLLQVLIFVNMSTYICYLWNLAPLFLSTSTIKWRWPVTWLGTTLVDQNPSGLQRVRIFRGPNFTGQIEFIVFFDLWSKYKSSISQVEGWTRGFQVGYFHALYSITIFPKLYNKLVVYKIELMFLLLNFSNFIFF